MWKICTILPATLAAALLAQQAPADDSSSMGSWTINRISQNTCEAAGPASGDAQLAIGIIGPEFKLLISSSGFNFPQGNYPVAISINGGPQVAMNALGEDGVYAIAIVHDFGMALRQASSLAATAAGKTYTFTFSRADVAMDAASRCASEPSYLESFAHPPQDIPGASGWKLVDDLPNTDRCSVRRNGEEVDTILMLGREGQLTLVAGRGDWAYPSSKETATLQIDNAPPQDVDALVFDNLIFVAIPDGDMRERLMHAKQLHWHFVRGDFRADIDGLEVATDALRTCNLEKAGSGRN